MISVSRFADQAFPLGPQLSPSALLPSPTHFPGDLNYLSLLYCLLQLISPGTSTTSLCSTFSNSFLLSALLPSPTHFPWDLNYLSLLYFLLQLISPGTSNISPGTSTTLSALLPSPPLSALLPSPTHFPGDLNYLSLLYCLLQLISPGTSTISLCSTAFSNSFPLGPQLSLSALLPSPTHFPWDLNYLSLLYCLLQLISPGTSTTSLFSTAFSNSFPRGPQLPPSALLPSPTHFPWDLNYLYLLYCLLQLISPETSTTSLCSTAFSNSFPRGPQLPPSALLPYPTHFPWDLNYLPLLYCLLQLISPGTSTISLCSTAFSNSLFQTVFYTASWEGIAISKILAKGVISKTDHQEREGGRQGRREIEREGGTGRGERGDERRERFSQYSNEVNATCVLHVSGASCNNCGAKC